MIKEVRIVDPDVPEQTEVLDLYDNGVYYGRGIHIADTHLEDDTFVVELKDSYFRYYCVNEQGEFVVPLEQLNSKNLEDEQKLVLTVSLLEDVQIAFWPKDSA